MTAAFDLVTIDTPEVDRAARGQFDRAADQPQLQRKQIHERHLRDERLGGRDADLEPRARIEDRVALARHLRAHHVRDREDGRAAPFRVLERFEDDDAGRLLKGVVTREDAVLSRETGVDGARVSRETLLLAPRKT